MLCNGSFSKPTISWSDKLRAWESGTPQTYDPTECPVAFFYETSACDHHGKLEYNEVYITSPELSRQSTLRAPDYSAFRAHLDPKTRPSEYAVSFDSLSPGTRLVVPVPRRGRRFANIREFIDNASERQQTQFWKLAAAEIKEQLKYHDRVFVSTHGLGVNYFHLRIECRPKYYTHLPFTRMDPI